MNKIVLTKKGYYIVFGAKRYIDRMFGITDIKNVEYDTIEDNEKKTLTLIFKKC